MARPPKDWITVKTTLPTIPYLPLAAQPVIRTERLLLRPWTQDDLAACHELRLQPEVMQWTGQGRPDADLEATRKVVDRKLSAEAVARNLEYAICLASSGEMIGCGGSHQREGEFGWPVLGYMLRKEAWGMGYGSEFVRGFLDMWWALPREVCEVKVDRKMVKESGEDGLVRECFTAITVSTNGPSQKVLDKCGFSFERSWEEADLRDPNDMVEICGYAIWKPEDGKAS